MSDCVRVYTGNRSEDHGFYCDECGQVPRGWRHVRGKTLEAILLANKDGFACSPDGHDFAVGEVCRICDKPREEVLQAAFRTLELVGGMDISHTLKCAHDSLCLSEFPGGHRCPDPDCDLRREDGHSCDCSIGVALTAISTLSLRYDTLFPPAEAPREVCEGC